MADTATPSEAAWESFGGSLIPFGDGGALAGRGRRARARYAPLTVEVIHPDGRVERHLLQLSILSDGTTVEAERDDAVTASAVA